MDELQEDYRKAMCKIHVGEVGVCSKCRYESGCLACDPIKCIAYWVRREGKRLGRAIADEYKR